MNLNAEAFLHISITRFLRQKRDTIVPKPNRWKVSNSAIVSHKATDLEHFVANLNFRVVSKELIFYDRHAKRDSAPVMFI